MDGPKKKQSIEIRNEKLDCPFAHMTRACR